MGQCRKDYRSPLPVQPSFGVGPKRRKNPGAARPADGPARPRAIIWNGLAVLIGQLRLKEVNFLGFTSPL